MQLLHSSDISSHQGNQVFRYSRAKAIVALLMLAAGLIAFCFLGQPRLGPIVYYLVAVCLLVTLCFSGYFSARFRSSNWLVELTNQELLIKFRSYLNYRFSDDDPTV